MPQGQAWVPFYSSTELSAIVERGSLAESDLVLLKKVQARLAGPAELTPEQAQFLQQPMFRRLAAAIDAAVTNLSTENTAPERGPIFTHAADFLAALEDYEASGSREAAVKMRNELSALEALAGAAGTQLHEVVGNQYWNYNLHLSVGETFMQTFFSAEPASRAA